MPARIKQRQFSLQGNGVLKPHPNVVREHELKRVDSNGLSGEERRCSRWSLAQSHMSNVAAWLLSLCHSQGAADLALILAGSSVFCCNAEL